MEHNLDPIQFSHFAKSWKWLAKHSCCSKSKTGWGERIQWCSPRKANGAIVVMWKSPVLLIHANLFNSNHCLHFYFPFFCLFSSFFFPFSVYFPKRLVPAELNWLGIERNFCTSEGQTKRAGFCVKLQRSINLCLAMCQSFDLLCFMSLKWQTSYVFCPLFGLRSGPDFFTLSLLYSRGLVLAIVLGSYTFPSTLLMLQLLESFSPISSFPVHCLILQISCYSIFPIL